MVSAGIGAGHDRAAQELARRLRAVGCACLVVDVLALSGADGRRLRSSYAWLLRNLPVGYDLAMRFWARWPTPLERFVAARAHRVEDDLERLAATYRPDLVVSLYNLASQCLGRLRLAGRLHVPVVTYVTDPGAHPYWVHPGVDRHLAVLPATAEGLRDLGARGVQVAGPLVQPQFPSPVDRPTARRRWALPVGPVVVLSAGSWGSGRVLHTLDRLLASAVLVPVVLCAHDRELARQVAARRAVALGWVDDMAGLLAAADVVVDNAGGLTCLEAVVAGRAVVLSDVLPGHGRFNAQTLDRCGAAIWVRHARDLVPVVERLGSDEVTAGRQADRARSLLAVEADPAWSVLAALSQAR